MAEDNASPAGPFTEGLRTLRGIVKVLRWPTVTLGREWEERLNALEDEISVDRIEFAVLGDDRVSEPLIRFLLGEAGVRSHLGHRHQWWEFKWGPEARLLCHLPVGDAQAEGRPLEDSATTLLERYREYYTTDDHLWHRFDVSFAGFEVFWPWKRCRDTTDALWFGTMYFGDGRSWRDLEHFQARWRPQLILYVFHDSCLSSSYSYHEEFSLIERLGGTGNADILSVFIPSDQLRPDEAEEVKGYLQSKLTEWGLGGPGTIFFVSDSHAIYRFFNEPDADVLAGSGLPELVARVDAMLNRQKRLRLLEHARTLKAFTRDLRKSDRCDDRWQQTLGQSLEAAEEALDNFILDLPRLMEADR